MGRKIYTMVGSLVLVLLLATPAFAANVVNVDQFADIKGHPFGEQVMTDMLHLGVLKGEPRQEWVKGQQVTRYYALPEQNISRWEFAVFLARALDLPAGKELPFKDAKDIPPVAKEYIAALYENDIIQGKQNSDGSFSFKPYDPVLRAEVVKMLYNALNTKEVGKLNNPFRDVNVEADDWVYDEILTCHQLGIIQGWTADKFVPYQQATRVQVMAIISRFLENDAANPPRDKELEAVVSGFYDKLAYSLERGRQASGLGDYLTGRALDMHQAGIGLWESGHLTEASISHPVWPPKITVKSDRLAKMEGKTNGRIKSGNSWLEVSVTETISLRKTTDGWKIYSVETKDYQVK